MSAEVAAEWSVTEPDDSQKTREELLLEMQTLRREMQGKVLLSDEQVETRLAAIVESSDDAIVSKTLDGIIQTWNQGAERIFGYKAEEIIGKSINILVPA